MSILTSEELAIANSFAEHYLDITDSLPNDIQRNISDILETDTRVNGIMESIIQERINYEATTANTETSQMSLNKLEQCFLQLQEINDNKLGYTTSILELIDENLKVLENDKKLIEKNENLRQLFINGLPEANLSKSTIMPQIPTTYNHPATTPSWNFGKTGKKGSATSPYHHDYDFELTPYHRNSPPYFTTPQQPPPCYDPTSPSYNPALPPSPGGCVIGEGTPNASPLDDEESRVNVKGALPLMTSPPSRSKRHRRAKGVIPGGEHYVYGNRTFGKNKMATSTFGTVPEDGSGRRSVARNAALNLSSSVGLGKRRRRKRKTLTTTDGGDHNYKSVHQNRLAAAPSAHSSSANFLLVTPVNTASPRRPPTSDDEDDDYPPRDTTPPDGHVSTGGTPGGGVGQGAEPRYCLCDRVSFGEMIACDNERCPLEWFHFACVGLTGGKPKGRWYCPRCRRDPGGKSCKYPPTPR